MVFLQKTPISSEAFYTSEQDISIYQVSVFPNSTIKWYAASNNWVQEEVTSEQLIASTDKQTWKGH